MADRHFKGKTGTIYIQHHQGDDLPYEVWFEDFCIIGAGDSELTALRDAVCHVADIGDLVASAIGEIELSSVAHAASGGE